MDNAGWHAQRRAKQQDRNNDPYRGPDGLFQPVAQVMPLDEGSMAGYNDSPIQMPSPPPRNLPYHAFPSPIQMPEPSIDTNARLSRMTAVERSNAFRVARTNPHLQFMVGPLLHYDTVDELGVWHGHVLIVTADAGSVYEPHPILMYEWNPEQLDNYQRARTTTSTSFDLGPHPADPYSLTSAILQNPFKPGPFTQCQQVPGHEIWVYAGRGGTFTFWRFSIQVPLSQHEMKIFYSLNHGQKLSFFVPGRGQNMRWAGYSCNGFSAGVNPDDFRGPGFSSGYDPLWVDLLMHHEKEPFHLLAGGGDQIYCDAITREPELQPWVSESSPERRKNYRLTEDMILAIDRFYFNHYCKMFRSGAFARANCSIPMVNMTDDHDLIDGFGSYPDDLQMSPVFRHIGSRGYFFFLLFQCFINPDVDGVKDGPGMHLYQSLIIGGDGAYVPFKSHSFLTYLGPKAYMLLLDCRAERRLDQVCGQLEYEKVFDRLDKLPMGVDHLILQLGIPIAYPRLVFLERSLGSTFNPLTALGKSGSMGLSGFVNKFNADAELLDDLNDHWCSDNHKKERNWFVEKLQQFAKRRVVRITIFSGDVHAASVGLLKTLSKGKGKQEVPPSADHRYMANIVSSAIVNTPPPAAVITLVSSLATKVHRTMHNADTDESMVPLFDKGTDGTNRKQKYIMGQRNWCRVKLIEATGDMLFDIRVEKEKGGGQTTGYAFQIPAPRWTAGT